MRENCIVVDSHKIHSYKAALIASFIRWAMYKNGNGFAFETVMSHKSKIKEIAAAKKKGYKIYLYFVCIDNPDINIERVKDRVYLFDNSDKTQELIAEIENGKLRINSNFLPNWFYYFVLPYYD